MCPETVPFEWDANKAAAAVAHASACRGELQFAGWRFYIFPKSALVARLYKKVGQALSPANRELQFAGRRTHQDHLSSYGHTARTRTLRGATMKATYDFSKGKRGRVVAEPPLEPGKVRITIRLDEDLVDYFGAIADRSGGKAGYQTLINSALREYVEGKTPKWEETLRRIIREEISRNSAA
jgi:uncharacterized protein (DUF4415 family)